MTSLRQRVRDVALGPAVRMTRCNHEHAGAAILVIQPDHLGDVLLAQPAVRAIRERFPERHIIGVVGPWSREIAGIAWPVDDLVTVDFPGFDRASNARNPLDPYRALRPAVASLVGLDAGPAFILRPDAWWAAWLAAIVTPGPIVTSGEPGMDRFATRTVDLSPHAHTTARAIALALELDRDEARTITSDAHPLSLPHNSAAAANARSLLDERGIREPYIIIHPGSGADVKLWPADRWRRVGDVLARNGLSVVVTGAAGEAALCEAVAGSASAHSLAGKTPLPVLIELLRGAALVMGPDSGPLHLAVGCPAPTIHLFGPSDPLRWGPWGPASRHRVVHAGWSCPRCGDLSPGRPAGCGCMLAITTDEVTRLALAMVEQHVPR